MTFFESLLVLLAIATALLQVSRRLTVPYPTILAGAGALLALVPGTPTLALDPHTALALFIAPALVDAAFDFPFGAVKRYWRPLFALAVVAVLLTTAAVAAVGVVLAGLPPYAAIALGAVVAPPDAAAATAIMRSVSLPRRSVLVLKGESLLNDATALLLFTGALTFHVQDVPAGELGLRLALAAPAGVALGIACAWLWQRLLPFVTGTLGGNLLEFLSTFGIWILAERLGLSAVLCVVAFAMSLARTAALVVAPRVRIHSFAVWDSAVFVLNVLAFLLMGLQARDILASMPADQRSGAFSFASVVVGVVIGVRLVWLVLYNRLAQCLPVLRGALAPAPFTHGILIGWSGMRGLVTLAAVYALPASFPQRDLIVLSAFAVVLATLVLQGLTLAPLAKWLRLDGDDGLREELNGVRQLLARHALSYLQDQNSPHVEHWREAFRGLAAAPTAEPGASDAQRRSLGVAVLQRQRAELETLRAQGRVGPDAFLLLQEELDFAEVALTGDEGRRVEEA